MVKMNPMVSMQMTPEEKAEQMMPMPVMDRAEFPYGLRICLTQKELEKMDCDPADAVVGGMVHIHAMARITDVSSSDGAMGKASRIELQIEDMCIEDEQAENDQYDSPGRVLYDNKPGMSDD